ncbi:hypothetical protein QQF64_011929 [Cirrhinus molitorella]|uniref:Uncharacterized protein n=1 Tax=Cirrhinus molitorella TaxID=172907 RepID=A0ABR3LU35_9TELE
MGGGNDSLFPSALGSRHSLSQLDFFFSPLAVGGRTPLYADGCSQSPSLDCPDEQMAWQQWILRASLASSQLTQATADPQREREREEKPKSKRDKVTESITAAIGIQQLN